jgi:hypothetical protein
LRAAVGPRKNCSKITRRKKGSPQTVDVGHNVWRKRVKKAIRK